MDYGQTRLERFLFLFSGGMWSWPCQDDWAASRALFDSSLEEFEITFAENVDGDFTQAEKPELKKLYLHPTGNTISNVWLTCDWVRMYLLETDLVRTVFCTTAALLLVAGNLYYGLKNAFF